VSRVSPPIRIIAATIRNSRISQSRIASRAPFGPASIIPPAGRACAPPCCPTSSNMLRLPAIAPCPVASAADSRPPLRPLQGPRPTAGPTLHLGPNTLGGSGGRSAPGGRPLSPQHPQKLRARHPGHRQPAAGLEALDRRLRLRPDHPVAAAGVEAPRGQEPLQFLPVGLGQP